ncbi:MAG: STAS domain-containing protein [Casimicrobiaceae bacterium]
MAIVVQQKLDWTAYRVLRPAIARAVGDPGRGPIHIDLSAVTAMEPAGIGALVVLREFAAGNRKAIVLDGVDPRFGPALRDCGLCLNRPASARFVALPIR